VIKLLHIGAMNGNLGDNIAIKNVQKSLLSERNDIKFVMANAHGFWKKQNNPDFILETIKKNKVDGVVIGGGGLVEYHSYKTQLTKQKLPLNHRIIKESGVPIFLYGVGINTFRGNPDWPDGVKDIVRDIFESVTECSLRNDGSIEKAKKFGLYNDKIIEIPDPGLLHNYQSEKKTTISKGFFQPAENGNKTINKDRFLSFEKYIKSIPTKYGLDIFPHTKKDFGFKGNYLVKQEKFSDLSKFEKVDESFKRYLDFDYGVVMRGHGQLVSIGMNIPALYLSTQDKVSDFSMKNGFSEYNVDVTEESWVEKFELMMDKIRNDKSYVSNWYEIQNENMKQWVQMDKEFSQKCLSHI